MNKPLFNFSYVENTEKLPKNNTQLMLMYIEDIIKKEGMMMFSQMCDAGYRMGIKNEDYKYWNQCTFEDIDYKKYMAVNNGALDPETIYDALWNWIYDNYKDILYYAELSRSKKGFHFIFYFNVNRTKNNRLMCKALSIYVIHKAFEACSLKYILDTKGVYDNCTNSFYQPCFLTLNDYKINKECTGMGSGEMLNNNYFNIKSIYDKLTTKKYTKKEKSTIKNDEWNIEFENSDICYNGPYLEHHERWNLFDYLSGLCGEDDDRLKEEWIKCARQLPEGNGHNTEFYIKEPYKNHWDKKRDTNNYIDKEVLRQFGYSIKFINNNNHGNNFKEKTKKIRKERVYLS